MPLTIITLVQLLTMIQLKSNNLMVESSIPTILKVKTITLGYVFIVIAIKGSLNNYQNNRIYMFLI